MRGRLVQGAARSGEAGLRAWARLRRDAQQRPVIALWALPMIVFVAVSVPGGASRPALLEVLADVVERSSRSAPLVRVQGTSLLESGDFVRTDARGRALITFDDGSTILVEGGGGFAYSVRQGDLGSAVVVLAQAAGRSWYSISRILSPDSRYELRVGSAAAVVRAGAAFEALVDQDGTATITMEAGSLEVSAAGATVAVGSGQRTVVRPGQAPSSPSPALSSSTVRQSPDGSPAGSPAPSPAARVEPEPAGFSTPARPSAPPSPQPSAVAPAASPTPASPLPTPAATPMSPASSSMTDPSPSAPEPTPIAIALPTPEPAPALPSPNPAGTLTPPPAPSILPTPTPLPTPSPLAAPTPSPTETPVPTPTVLPTPTPASPPTLDPLPLPTPSVPLPTPPLSSEPPLSEPQAPSAPPAAIALRAVSWAAVDGLGVIVAAPLGLVAGDVLIAQVAFDKGSDVTVTPPAGWTLVRRTDNGQQLGLAVYSRVAGAAEPPHYSWSFSNQTEAAIGLLAFSGVDAASPLDGEAGQETSNGTAHTTPSITTTAAGRRIVSAHAVRKATTWTPPAGMTERFDLAAPGNVTLAGSDATQAVPGATGGVTAVSADQQQGVTHVLALRQAGAAASSQ